MDREAFEQLVSDWLDRPDDVELRRRIARAIEATPELAEVRDQWRRLHALLQAEPTVLRNIRWERFHGHVHAAVSDEDGSSSGAPLDAMLQSLPGVADRVDWQRQRQRIANEITRETLQPSRSRVRWPRFLAAAGVFAAAAAVVLLVLYGEGPRRETTTTVPGRATVTIASAARQPLPPASRAVAYARVTPAENGAATPPPAERPPELFLMIGPPQTSMASPLNPDPTGYF